MVATETNKMRIHVKKASGASFESLWPAGTSDAAILKSLSRNKAMFGYNGTVKKADPSFGRAELIDFADPKSGFAYDHPDTMVIEVDNDGKELRRLKGPPLIRTTSGEPVTE